MNRGSVVAGSCDPAFAGVRDTFEENFASRNELGASVSIVLDGKLVVDLWGGVRNLEKSLPWEKQTLVTVQSISKGILAVLAAIMIEEGLLDPEKKVAYYWPEFARAGKDAVTVEHLICHQAGVIYMDHAKEGALFDTDHLLEALTLQEPAWIPGSKGGYHSSTYFILVSHLLKIVTGKSPNTLFRQYLGDPLNLDMSFGVEAEHWSGMADFIINKEETFLSRIGQDERFTRAWKAVPKNMDELWNQPEIKGSEHHCFGHGRDLARLFGTLARGGELAGKRICSEETVANLRRLRWEGICPLLDLPIRMAFGLFLNTPGFVPAGRNPNTFGTFGAGGSGGFADPDLKLGFGYAMNFMCAGMSLGPRYQALVDAVYDCV